MVRYIGIRLGTFFPRLLGISVVVFCVAGALPGDPTVAMISPEAKGVDLEVIRHSIGYYDPAPVKYIKWLKELLKGNLGYSQVTREPIVELLSRRMGNTLLLSLASLFLSSVAALAIGLWSAYWSGSFFDRTMTVLTFIGFSIPAFFLGLILIWVFAFSFGWFPLSGMEAPGAGGSFFSLLWHMVLPVATLSILQVASLSRYTRFSVLDVLQQNYIRMARAKGLSEHKILWYHVLRNSLIPVVTLITLSIGNLFSGAVLTETVFDWPGMGTLMLESVYNLDYPVIIAGTMVFAVTVLFANLLADILYSFLDPRVSNE